MEFNPPCSQDLGYTLVENEDQNFSFRLLFSLLQTATMNYTFGVARKQD